MPQGGGHRVGKQWGAMRCPGVWGTGAGKPWGAPGCRAQGQGGDGVPRVAGHRVNGDCLLHWDGRCGDTPSHRERVAQGREVTGVPQGTGEDEASPRLPPGDARCGPAPPPPPACPGAAPVRAAAVAGWRGGGERRGSGMKPRTAGSPPHRTAPGQASQGGPAAAPHPPQRRQRGAETLGPGRRG